jgi:hypothetical protein
MIEAIRVGVLSASRLPKVIEAWEGPVHAEFSPRTAWSLLNAFSEVAKATHRGRRCKAPSDSVRSLGGSCPLTDKTGPSPSVPSFTSSNCRRSVI